MSDLTFGPSSISPSPWRSHWLLDPDILFLNHGSFGACPLPVLRRQEELREQLEREPVRFFEREFEPLLDAARTALAEFVGTQPDALAFVPNATHGVNTVLRSLSFQPEDELLVTSHEYNACRNALNAVAERSGATVVQVDIALPIESPEQVLEAIVSGVSSRTRLALIDHVTSQTALVMPLRAIIQELRHRGIEVLVDGAHAPGMVELALDELGAAYYTGNCHKWLCAPKGAGFLYVRPDNQSEIRPLAISHGANSPRSDRTRFHLEFDWVGTTDPTPWLCVPEAIQFMANLLPGGWPGLMQHNHQMGLTARAHLAHKLGLSLPVPDAMIGAMAVLPLPDGPAPALHDDLLTQFRIEVPIIPWPQPPQRLIRISAQIYNTLAEYEVLAHALDGLLKE